MLSPIRVLIVDDSALIRQMLTHALSLDPRIEVAGIARTGVEAIEKARLLEPDVITLDIEMPELTGIEALPFIIRETNARVLMLSSLDDPDTTYAALSAGAVDFIPKPKGGFASSLSDLADVLVKKIKIAYRISPDRRMTVAETGAAGKPGAERAGAGRAGTAAGHLAGLVVLAASTGGPPALERVFSGLTAGAPVAYLVVQHLPAGFTTSFARRLGRIGGLPVSEGAQGLPIEAGKGYVAPYGTHMVVSRSPGGAASLALTDDPPMHGVRPSADPLFLSAAAAYGPDVTGVVLTGMGQDGAAGLRAIRDGGGHTIAQDEASSVIWGMPGSAVKLGAAQAVVPLDKIAAEIRRTVREGS